MDLPRFSLTLSARGRLAANSFMAAFDGEEISPDHLDAANLIVANLDDEIFQILAAIMDEGKSRSRIFAAGMFVVCKQQFPKAANDYQSAGIKAIEILVAALCSENSADVVDMIADTLTRTDDMPDQLEQPLKQLLEHNQKSVRVCAAPCLLGQSRGRLQFSSC